MTDELDDDFSEGDDDYDFDAPTNDLDAYAREISDDAIIGGALVVPIQRGPDARIPERTRSDGVNFRYLMVFDNSERAAYSDHADSLVGLLIDGYLNLDFEGRYQARLAAVTAAAARGQVYAASNPDVENLTEAETAAVLTNRGFADHPTVDVWESSCPLFVVADAYAPEGPRPRPVAQPRDPNIDPDTTIVWLSAADDDATLRAIAAVGEIQLYTANV